VKTRTVEVREGELLGPIDWDYDFAAHGSGQGGSMFPKRLQENIERLRTLEAGIARGEVWEATTDGGVPRCGWGRVLAIGMYDGWPYWQPVPSVLIAGSLGAEWSSVSSLSDIREVAPKEDGS
jgi:hypothetical protein